MRTHIGLAAAALAALVLVAGCGEKEEPEAGPEADTPEVATGTDDVVLQVFTGGGYVEPIVARRQYPEIVLYGDGRLLTAAGQSDDPLPRLDARVVDDEEMAAILRDAVAAGLTEETDYGMPQVTDLPSTTVVFETAEGRTENSAYALGHEDADPGVDDDAAAAREELNAFIDRLHEGLAEPYEPEAYVVTIEYSGLAVRGEEAVEWPLAADRFASEKRREVCAVIDGADAAKLERAARGAPVDAVWTADGARAEVAIRPAIGLEDRCPPDGALYAGSGA